MLGDQELTPFPVRLRHARTLLGRFKGTVGRTIAVAALLGGMVLPQLGVVPVSADTGTSDVPFASGDLNNPPVNPPPSLTRMDCGGEAGSVSPPDTTPVNMLFWNETLAPVQVDWIDFSGNRVNYFTLQPGDWHVQPTWTGHVWVVTDDSDPTGGYGNFTVGNGLCQALFVAGTADGTADLTPHAETYDPGCLANELPANDDGSTDFVPLPFTMDFFGVGYSGGYINNNGNMTFNGPQSTYTPYGIAGAGVPILAPFFADVYTYNQSYTVHYGTITVGGRPALCVDWAGVGYYSAGARHLNSFQMIIVDRPDLGTATVVDGSQTGFGGGVVGETSVNNGGNNLISADTVDLIYNYDQVQWESGEASGSDGEGLGGASARVGYSNGQQAFELDGSGQPGSFLDFLATDHTQGNPGGLIHQELGQNQTEGQLVFQIPNGASLAAGDIQGTVYFQGVNGNGGAAGSPTPIPGALIEACNVSGACLGTRSDGAGQYSAEPLQDGLWTITANPPSTFSPSDLPPGRLAPLSIQNANTLTGEDIVIQGPTPPPVGTGIVNSGQPPRGTYEGLPVVYWGQATTLTTLACPGGTVAYDVFIAENGNHITGFMTESPANSGQFSAQIPPFYPNHGDATITFTVSNCSDSAQNGTSSFNIYIDPSGTVQTISAHSIQGATVTLLVQDPITSMFSPVPGGSPIMDASNRTNPDHTDGIGHFGWNVIPGTYRVTAQFTTSDGTVCVDPNNPGSNVVSTGDLVVTPTQGFDNLNLTLDCLSVYFNSDPNAPPPTQGQTPELDSLLLFGAGAAGLAGYARTALIARRRRDGEHTDTDADTAGEQ